MELLFRTFINERGVTALLPSDKAAAEWLGKAKIGQDVLMSGRRPRNPAHHRKMFALLNLVLENQSHYLTIEHLLAAIKVGTGHCDIYPMKDGNAAYIPKSISFASLDQTAFEQFYDKALDYICAKIIPRMVREELQEEVLLRISG